MLTRQRKSQKKRLMNAPKLNLKEQGLSTLWHNNETSFNTHRAWGIHSGRRRSMEKMHCTLSERDKKFCTTHRAISLSGLLDWCTPTKIEKKKGQLLHLIKNKLFPESLMSRITLPWFLSWLIALQRHICVQVRRHEWKQRHCCKPPA